MAREDDYCSIMTGLSELDLQGKAVPSDLVLIGADAFPLAMNPRGQVLIAASRYGQGRVVVLGHEEYLTRFPGLIENALMWLMPCTGDASIVGIQKNLGPVANNFSNSSISTELGDFREGLAVYITDAYSVDNCVKDLIAFVKAGGGLIIAGQAWNWAKANPKEDVFLNFPGNKVCSVAGIYFSEHQGELAVIPVPSNIPSSWLAVSIVKDFKNDLEFLLKGVPQFDIQGGAVSSELMVHGLLAFPIAVTPQGRVFIAGAYYGQGRVIVLTHEGFLGRESLSTFLINAINWLDEGRKGVIGIIPKLTGAQKILSKSGLNCQLTNFKKDLSVHVCTSYSDAECEKIQEFVAEGSGLLIGGHAWNWAQKNRGRNVMTEYPGNRILNKMGLCILGSTVNGGLYKSPDINQGFKDVYHFRKVLRGFGKHVTKGQKLTPHVEGSLKQLGNDCTRYLRMRTHDCASYNSMVTHFTDMVKDIGVPQVSSKCPVKTPKDCLMLQIATELYKTMSDPDALLPHIIKDIPKFPTVTDARVRINADTGGAEAWISTGLYLSPGMRTQMVIPPELIGKNWKVQIGSHTDNIGAADVLKRAPVVYERFLLDNEKVQICNLWGGLIYLIAPPKTKVDGVEIVVQTAVKAPYFKSGFMHAGYPIMIQSGSTQGLINPEGARKTGLWGHIHELGHNQQRGVWEFPPHTTECTCNLWSVYVHEEVLGVNRATAHKGLNPDSRQARARDYVKGGRDLKKWTMWIALETYMQLQEKFGWDAFKKVFAAYHVMTEVPKTNPGKMNLYAETFSKVVNMNLSSFFKAWGWPIEPSTEQKISHLPEWSDHPMKQYA
ncbi:TRPM8 channel-associated factor homolog [Paramisgurnus dabryanus]|uniref:TRPM8 channel-associated factor homolog n=1 Tax=Paramisgurnus dabryanus TaxID=90735 RepID=UPI0031F377DF